MSSGFDALKDLIDHIQKEYAEITDEWLQGTKTKINLKRTYVSDVDINGPIYHSIMKYVQLLNERSAGVTSRLSFVCSYQVTARVKTQNSIEYKIQNYKTCLHEFGKVAINKCINDLFGVRIILDTPLVFKEILAFIEETYQGKYKCIDSSKHDYKAVHLYFKDNNQVFPWELQVWNRRDMENNLASHRKYKQKYTTWERESKEGGIIDG